MTVRVVALYSAAMLALFPASGRAEEKTLQDGIVGAWIMTSVYDEYDSGKKVNPWGAGARGVVTFDSAGHFSEIILGEIDPKMKTRNPRKPDALIVAYFGTYKVAEDGKTVAMHILRASNSQRDNNNQTWTVALKGDALSAVASRRKAPDGIFAPHIELVRGK